MKLRLNGKARDKKVRVGKKWVELTREDTDKVFVVIAEFGNTRHSAFPDTAAGCCPRPACSRRRHADVRRARAQQDPAA